VPGAKAYFIYERNKLAQKSKEEKRKERNENINFTTACVKYICIPSILYTRRFSYTPNTISI